MAVKYYSDKTKSFYPTEAECQKAEEALLKTENEQAAARKKDADEVQKALKELNAAREHYHEVLNTFCKKHGTYHASISSDDGYSWQDILSLFI